MKKFLFLLLCFIGFGTTFAATSSSNNIVESNKYGITSSALYQSGGEIRVKFSILGTTNNLITGMNSMVVKYYQLVDAEVKPTTSSGISS